MTLSAVDAVVFDFDGVLVSSVDVKTRAFAELYAPHGPEIVAKVVAYHLRHGGISRFEKFRHFHRAFLGQSLNAEDEARLGARFAALVEDAVAEAPWVPGAREFLERYHAELPLFVASGTPEEELMRIVERRGAAHYFTGVYGSPLGKGDIIRAILEKHAFEPSRVLMIGDSITDYEGARVAGVSFLGIGPDASSIPSGTVLREDLTSLEEFLAATPGRTGNRGIISRFF